MSRCFPFPPPGYEKKPRTEDDLLRKEKHKEKKHKKDKKDKEKRVHKEKSERDRGDGKQKEKKDRKEKHREKKKDRDKEKDIDKGKSSTSGEKNIDGEAEVQKLNQKDQQVKDGSKILVEKKQMQLVQSQYVEKPFRNGLTAERIDDAKFVRELDRRIRDDEKGSASLAVGRIPAAGTKNNEQMDKSLDKLAEPMAERKENILEKRIDFRKMDGQRIKETSRSLGHQVVQSVGANRSEGITRSLGHQVVQSVGANRSEGITRPLVKPKIEKAGMEEKSKLSKGREEVDKQQEKHKDTNREEKVKTREKDGKKEKKERKRELKSKGEDKFVDFNKNNVSSNENIVTLPHLTKDEERSSIFCEGIHRMIKEFEANDGLSDWNIIPSHQKKEDADKGNATDGNIKKRKEFEPNGFLIDVDSRSNKVAHLSPHPVTCNGRMEPCLIMPPSPSISYKQVSTNSHKVNGVIGHQKVTSSSIKSLSRPKSAPTKPPHPDTKYLREVLSVPEKEKWVDFDDQSWLFNNEKRNTYKGINEGVMSEGSSVWAQAMEIESADIYALPYVIPY